MTVFTYSRVSAFNPNTSPVSLARSATGSIYDIGDFGFTTPLNLTLVATNTVTTTLISDASGMFPDFTLVDRTSVVFKSGAQIFVLTTTTPVPGPQGAASTVPGPPGPPTTDASLLAAGTVADARLPLRLQDEELSATILDRIEADAPKPPTLLHYDVFDRADGDLGTAPTGQAYITHYTNNQRPKIVNGQFISQPQDGTSVGSGYGAINFPVEPTSLIERALIFGSGSGQNSSASLVVGGRADGAPVTTVNEIIDRCVHLILTRTGISVQWRNSALGVPVSGPTFALSLPRNDGTEYEWKVERTASDTIRITDPVGGVHTVTDDRVDLLWGKSVYWQAVNQSQQLPTPGDETRITGLWTFAGEPGSVPQPEQMVRHPLNAKPLARAIKNTSGQPTTRMEVLSREHNTASGGLVDGRIQLTYFTPVDEFVVARVEAVCGATAVAGATLIRFGLYEVDKSDNLKLIAATPSDATLFAGTNAATSKSLGGDGVLPGTYRLKPGQRYAVGVLVVGSTNAGTIHGATVGSVLANLNPGRINGTVTGLTDLPATIATGTIGTSSLRPWFRFWAP